MTYNFVPFAVSRDGVMAASAAFMGYLRHEQQLRRGETSSYFDVAFTPLEADNLLYVSVPEGSTIGDMRMLVNMLAQNWMWAAF